MIGEVRETSNFRFLLLTPNGRKTTKKQREKKEIYKLKKSNEHRAKQGFLRKKETSILTF